MDTVNPFAEAKKYGSRFLVVRVAADSSCTGRIVELIADGQAVGAVQAARQVLAGTKPFLAGYAPGPVEGLSGSLLVYSPGYEYETGLSYAGGVLQAAKIKLVTSMVLPEDAQPGDCYNFYAITLVNGVQTAVEQIGTLCAENPPIGGSTGGNTGGSSGGSTGGSTWGGVSGPGNSATPPKTPCAALTRDGQNVDVQAQLNTLAGLLTDNKEHGLTVTYDAAGNPVFTTATGLSGQLNLGGWTAPMGASAIVHTHFADPASLSIFSEDDLRFLWDYYTNHSPANPSTFSFTVITASGTVYSLAVTNPTAFANFANAYSLSTPSSSLITQLFDTYHISATNTVAQNERWFAKMLDLNNTGLTLYKGDPGDFASWQQVSFTKNSTIALLPCN